MAQAMRAAADAASDLSVKAQYLDLESKWIRLAREVTRQTGSSLLHVVGVEDSLVRDKAAAPPGEATLQRGS